MALCEPIRKMIEEEEGHFLRDGITPAQLAQVPQLVLGTRLQLSWIKPIGFLDDDEEPDEPVFYHADVVKLIRLWRDLADCERAALLDP